MAMRCKKSATMLPEQWPNFFAICLRQRQSIQVGAIEESKSPFGVLRWKFRQFWLHLEEEHQPMRFAAVAMLRTDSDQVQIGWLNGDAEFFEGFAASACIRTFALLD